MTGNNPPCNESGRVMHLDRLFDLFFSGDDPKPISIKGFAHSMIPAILPGELIRILPAGDRTRLRSGDVVVFRYDDIFVAHRLVLTWRGRALTKGDNNPLCDPWISLADIVGVVEGKSSRWRLIRHFIVRERLLPCLWALAQEKWSFLRKADATDSVAVGGDVDPEGSDTSRRPREASSRLLSPAGPSTRPYPQDHLRTGETP
ncbi:MAG TPA: hypothetical protein PKH10_00070 [bacterium]|nr:hypothetical protein [bacterium]